MSHFAVLVVGSNPIQQLAPYHEFECTGHDDEFVQDIDVTDEKREDYETGTISVTVDEQGIEVPDDKLYREPTSEEVANQGSMGFMGSGCGGGISWTSRDWGDGRGHRAKVRYTPDGARKEDWSFKRVYGSFAKYMEAYEGSSILPAGESRGDVHKYGFTAVNEAGGAIQVINRTNPNYKWDWYVLGGRFRGFFLMEGGTRADSLLKCEVDMEEMRDAAEAKALQKFDRAMAAIAGREEPDFDALRAAHGLDAARTLYQQHPVTKSLHEADFWRWNGIEKELSGGDRVKHAAAARKNALRVFAVLRDGVWHEKGEMGWWACVSNEKSSWDGDFAKLWEDIPEDAQVSIYDCHI